MGGKKSEIIPAKMRPSKRKQFPEPKPEIDQMQIDSQDSASKTSKPSDGKDTDKLMENSASANIEVAAEKHLRQTDIRPQAVEPYKKNNDLYDSTASLPQDSVPLPGFDLKKFMSYYNDYAVECLVILRWQHYRF
jgi:hypothetical protein